jgi:hypothetical protein
MNPLILQAISWQLTGALLLASVCKFSKHNKVFFRVYDIYTFKMGLFGFTLLMVIILAVFGLGWQTFSSGVITGFEKAVDVGAPIVKDLTQEARNYVNSPEQLRTAQ